MHQIIFNSFMEFAIQLIKSGKAYVDDSSAEEISVRRVCPRVREKIAHSETVV